jgi:hypothetical protein
MGIDRGLDVNVHFASPTAFEYTPQTALFDAFRLKLVHGWVADSTSPRALQKLSYNQLQATLLEAASFSEGAASQSLLHGASRVEGESKHATPTPTCARVR